MAIDPDGTFPFQNEESKAIYALILRFFELCILIASSLATYNHFQESGKRLGEVTQFHLTHTIFSALFWGVNIGTALYFSHGDLTADIGKHTNSSWIKDCSWNYLWYNLFNPFRNWAMYLFFNYWEHVFVENDDLKYQKTRKYTYIFFIIIFFIFQFYAASFRVEDCPSAAYLPQDTVYFLTDIIIFVDSLWIVSWCWQNTKAETLIAVRASKCSPSLSQLSLFVSISLCFVVSLSINVFEVVFGTTQYHEANPFGLAGFTPLVLTFNIAIPSFLVLIVMWKRHYFTFDGNVNFELSVVSSHFNSTSSFNNDITSFYHENRMSTHPTFTSNNHNHHHHHHDDMNDDFNGYKDNSSKSESYQDQSGLLPPHTSSSSPPPSPAPSLITNLNESISSMHQDQSSPTSEVNGKDEHKTDTFGSLKSTKFSLSTSDETLEGIENSFYDDDDDDDDDEDDEDDENNDDNDEHHSTLELDDSLAERPTDMTQIPQELKRALLKAYPLEALHMIHTGNAEHPGEGKQNTVELAENMQPPSSALPTFIGFIMNIGLPELQLSLRRHSILSDRLLDACKPKEETMQNRCAANFEHVKQYEEIKLKAERLTASFLDYVNVTSTVLTLLKDLKSGSHEKADDSNITPLDDTFLLQFGYQSAFKPSAQKKCFPLSQFPTNLQSHKTNVKIYNQSSSGSRYSSDQNNCLNTYFDSITIGAPAAHALKFKDGGIRKLKKKLAKLKESKKNASSPLQHIKELECMFRLKARECAIISQALGGAVAAAVDVLERIITQKDETALLRIAKAGLLLHSVNLLSTRGKELAMIDDFAGAYESLNVTIRIQASDGETPTPTSSSAAAATLNSSAHSITSTTSTSATKYFDIEKFIRVLKVQSSCVSNRIDSAGLKSSSSMGDVAVTLLVDSTEHSDWLIKVLTTHNVRTRRTSSVNHSNVKGGKQNQLFIFDFKITPCLFNLGVNEQQTVANAMGLTSMQTEVNETGLKVLLSYHKKWCSSDASMKESKQGKLVEELLEQLDLLIKSETKSKKKTVDLLLVSCWCARLMGGARTTSCKSAKDRTSVFQSLEIARLALGGGVEQTAEEWLNQRMHGITPQHSDTSTESSTRALKATVEQELLDKLRSLDGVRLRNCKLNTGKAKYCFNKFQLETIPMELRPPPNTTGGNKS